MVDVGPVHVSGAVRARHARLIWQDGTLYVTHRRAGRITTDTLATSEPVAPETRNGVWRMQTDDGKTISATRKGCSG